MATRVSPITRNGLRCVLLCSIATLCVPAVDAAPGELDNSFGNAGRLHLLLRDANDNPHTLRLNAMTQQPDGKVVLAGTIQRYDIPGLSGDHFLVVRLNPDGTLDDTFDGDGWVSMDFDGSNSNDVAYAVLVQPDGKIVAAGQSTVFTPVQGANVALARFNADGSPDTGFGSNGRVSFDAGGGGIEEARGIVRRSDGGLVVVGTTDRNNEYDIFFAAFTSTGQPDTAFGTDGVTIASFGPFSTEQAFALAQQSDGALVAAGVGPTGNVAGMAAVRLTSAGALDTTFDGDGLVVVNFGDVYSTASAIALESDGKIVLAGSVDVAGERQAALVRLTTGGALDASFGGDGMVSQDFGAEWSYEMATGVAVEADGKIVIGGDMYGASSGTRDLFVARFTTSGAVDVTFGQQGFAIADFGQPGQPSNVEAFGLLRQADGRLLVGGRDVYAYQPQDLARFDSSGGGSGGVLSFRDYASSHAENAGTVTFNVRRTGGAAGTVSSNVRLGAAGGQASAGLGCDFSATLGPLTWATGDYADKQVTVTILDDSWLETADLFQVELTGAAGAALAQTTHDVYILYDGNDSQQPTTGTAGIEPSKSIGEAAGSVTLVVTRSDGSEDCAVVPYQTYDGYGEFPAVAGSDYVASSGVVQFNDGDVASKSISIPIINDTVGEADEQFGVQLSGNVAQMGVQFADVTILDDDGGFPGRIYVFAGDNTDEESDGPNGGPITLARQGGDNGVVSVTYTVTSGTATAGVDFVATTGTVVWQSGDAANKQIYVEIKEDTLEEANETYIVTISNPTGGAVLGSPTQWEQTILDNDTKYPGELRCWAYTGSLVIETTGARAMIGVTRDNGRDGAVSVDYSTSSGTATAGADYTAVSGTLNWADQSGCAPPPNSQCSGDPLRLVEIPVLDDADPEGDETFSLNLANPTGGATLSTSSSCEVTIYRSDPVAGSISWTPANAQVGEAAGSVTVTVTRSGGLQGEVSVSYRTLPNTATSGADYTDTSGTLTWANGEGGAKTVTVPILDDTLQETSEVFYVWFESLTGGAIFENPSYQYAHVTIIDDENNPGTIVFSTPIDVPEDVGNATVFVTRVLGTTGAVSVDYATVPNTAQSPGDYTSATGTLTWAAGVGDTKTITVPITNDTVQENRESFIVRLSNPAGGLQLPNTDITVEITDDDDPGDLAISPATVNVSETATTLNLTVTRSTGTSGAVSVGYATANDTATAGSDYTAASGTLTWADGASGPRTIAITILDDAIEEADETFAVKLTNPTGDARLQQASATVTIEDNDANPGQLRFAVASRDVSEAAATVQIDVERFGGSLGAVSVQYATAPGTALTGGDFAATPGTLNWADGDKSTRSFSIPIVNDTVEEPNENFTVVLSNPGGGAVLTTPAVETVTITNDDPPNGVLGLDVQSVTVTEGGQAVMQVTRTNGSGGAVQIDYETVDLTAAAPDDFVAESGTLTWPAGDTTPRTITIDTIDDVLDERPETFYVRLSNIQGGAFTGRSETVVTVDDNDVGPTGTIGMKSTAIIRLESSGVKVSVGRTGGFSGPATVDFATQDFTALAGSDYTATSGTLNWADGDDADKLITVEFNDDTTDEPDEAFRVVLSNATGAALDGAATTTTVTIEDNDLPPVPGVLSVTGPTSVDESATGINFFVSRATGADGAVSVDYATVAGTATEGADYAARTGTLDWANGDTTSKTVTVPIVNDTIDEPNETFALNLSNPTGGATLGTASRSTTIIDDDVSGPGTLGIVANVAVFETVGSAVVSVQRTGGFDGAVSVNYSTAPDTAVEVADFTAVNGTLTWNDGDGSVQLISIPIVNDTTPEDLESFTVTLSGPTGGATIGVPTRFVTITDDDVPGTLAFTQTAQLVAETAGSVTFSVGRSNGSKGAVSVNYATVAGTATAGSDYTTTSGTLDWADGDATNKTVTVPVLNDTAVEFDETFTIVLSGATGGATIGAADTATVTIESDEVPVPGTIRMASAAVTVGEADGSVVLSVERVTGSDGAVSIDYATVNGTATAADYTPSNGTLAWADGDTAVKTISVPITNDTLFEVDETFAVTLSNPQGGAILANPSTTVTIQSEDAAVPGTLDFAVTAVSVNESDGTVALSVKRTGGSDGQVSVSFATAFGTATGADFTATTGTLNWPDGDAAAKTITVLITNDTLFEADETFTVTLSDVTGGASLGASVATVTIVSEDLPQRGTLAMADASAIVGEAAGTVMITVNRGGGSDGAVGVDWETAPGTATVADFGPASGTLNWADGDATPKSFTVTITNDTLYELDEIFTVTLSNATGGAALGATTTSVTIISDDSPVTGTIRMAATAVSVNETDGSVTVTVERVGGSEAAVGVSYATATGTAGAGDFTGTSGTLSWANGDASPQTITVPITNDTAFEPDETFTVNLSNVTGGAALGTPTTTVTIVSEDPPQRGTLAMAVATASVAENLGSVTVSVTRTGGADGTVTVDFVTATGTAGPADFTAVGGTLTWSDGDAAPKVINVPITNDALFEPDETFSVSLSNATGGATLGAATTAVTIVSEDAPQRGTLAMTSTTLAVNEPAGTVTISVARTGGTDGPVGVSYTTTAGTASAADFSATSGNLNWADGESGTQTFTVAITNDALVESDEAFAVTLSNPTGGAALGAASTTVTIQDDDILVAPGLLGLTQSAVTVSETAGVVTLSVARTSGLGGVVSVQYATASGTATAGDDFTPATGTLTWVNGEAGTKNITINLVDDTTAEPDETFTLTLSNPGGGAGLGTASATVTVQSEDIPPDTTPDAFAFDDQANLPVNAEVTSNEITVTGINAPAAISIKNGEYSINGGDFTSAAGSVTSGARVHVRVVASSAYSTTVSATLTIGGVSDTFSVTTRAATTDTKVKAKSGSGSFGGIGALLLGALCFVRRRRPGLAPLGMVLCALVLSPAARAVDSGVYLGAGGGTTEVGVNAGEVARRLESATGDVVDSVDLDEQDFGYFLRVGYLFNRYFALEAAYYDFGNLEASIEAEVLDPAEFAREVAKAFPSNVHGPALSAMANWPFAEHFAAQLRVGVIDWNADVEVKLVGGGSGTYRAQDFGTDLIWGVGVVYRPTKWLDVSLEFTEVDLDDAVRALQLGLTWRTGWLSR